MGAMLRNHFAGATRPMHALEIARRRLRRRLRRSGGEAWRLAHRLVEEGRPFLLPILPSALARDILTRGYDPFTLERIYAGRPSGALGPLGKVADRLVLDLPVHRALRERQEAAVGEICAAAVPALRAELPEFRILSAPCGLAWELVGVAERFRRRHPDLLPRLRAWGVDPDPRGILLPEAARRTRAAGLRADFLREDLRRQRELVQLVDREGPFHLIHLAGLWQTDSPAGIGRLIARCAGYLEPGGTLLLDRWEPAEPSRVAAGLGIEMPCQPETLLRSCLAEAGLTIEREHPTGEGGCVLIVARKPLPPLPFADRDAADKPRALAAAAG